MADQKISALTADTSPTDDDLLVTVNDPGGTPGNKKVTIASLFTYLASYAMTMTNKILDTPVFRNWDGWEDCNETWVYTSGAGTNQGSVTITGVDLTAKYNVHDKGKFTQTTVKYFIITKVALVGSDTVLTLYFGTDSTIANAAISANYYSKGSSPQGFNKDPLKWSESLSGSHALTNPGGLSTIINFNSATLSLPIGSWYATLKGIGQVSGSSSGATYVDGGLSTSSSSESDQEFVAAGSNRAATTGTNIYPFFVRKPITVTSVTPLYLVCEAQAGSGTVTVGITPYYINLVYAGL